MDRESFVDALNEDLELEYRSIVQYIQHIATVKGAEFQATIEELRLHAAQELEHSQVLAEQIDFLEGVPSTHVPDFPKLDDAREALQSDLDLELELLERYRERTAQAEELQLPDVAGALAPLLEQTQEHARDLKAALG